MIKQYEAANITIRTERDGLVCYEKSLLALDKVSRRIVAAGKDAQSYCGNDNIEVFSPLRNGHIAYFDYSVEMFKVLLGEIVKKSFFRKPVIGVCVPDDITEVEWRAMAEALISAGAKGVVISETGINGLRKEDEALHEKIKLDVVIFINS